MILPVEDAIAPANTPYRMTNWSWEVKGLNRFRKRKFGLFKTHEIVFLTGLKSLKTKKKKFENFINFT